MVKIKNNIDINGTRSESNSIQISSGKRGTEKGRGLIEMFSYGKPVTSRMLMKILNTERSNCTRILKDLENEGKIKVVKSAKCETTGQRVNYYLPVQKTQTSLFGNAPQNHWSI